MDRKLIMEFWKNYKPQYLMYELAWWAVESFMGCSWDSLNTPTLKKNIWEF